MFDDAAEVERRLRKRHNAVYHVTHEPAYLVLHAQGLHPKAPDPADLTVSRRRWAASVQAWRKSIEQLCKQHGIAE